jgi:transposase
MCWSDVARAFLTSWESVYRSVSWVVHWGLEHRDLDGITAIGVDEILWHKGKFLTLVYQINGKCKRLIWIGKERTKASFSRFFDLLGEKRSLARPLPKRRISGFAGVFAPEEHRTAPVLVDFCQKRP